MSNDEINDIKDERDCGKCVWRSEHGCTVWDCEYISRQTLHSWIEEHPEMKEMRKDDKVEVVRCKDCKNWHPFPDKLFGYCRREYWDDDGQYRLKVETNHDDFCSYGDRRDV